MVKQNIICLAIGVLCGFTPWFSWLNSDFLEEWFCLYINLSKVAYVGISENTNK